MAELSNRIDFQVIGESDRLYIDVEDLISLLKGINDIPSIELDRNSIAYIISLLKSMILSVNNINSNDLYLNISNKHLKKLFKSINKKLQKQKKVSEKVEAIEEVFDKEEDESDEETNG